MFFIFSRCTIFFSCHHSRVVLSSKIESLSSSSFASFFVLFLSFLSFSHLRLQGVAPILYPLIVLPFVNTCTSWLSCLLKLFFYLYDQWVDCWTTVSSLFWDSWMGFVLLFSLVLFSNSEYLELLMLMVFGDIHSVYWHLIYSSVFEVLFVQFSCL